jgi:hypothetical protein
MAKIKYLVMGIENKDLENLLGTMIQGELTGLADVLVMPNPVPKAYTVLGSGAVKEVTFGEFLGFEVQAARKRVEESQGQKLKLVPKEG